MSKIRVSVVDDEDVKEFRAAVKEIKGYDEDKLREFFISVGFYDKTGKVAERYRGIFPGAE